LCAELEQNKQDIHPNFKVRRDWDFTHKQNVHILHRMKQNIDCWRFFQTVESGVQTFDKKLRQDIMT